MSNTLGAVHDKRFLFWKLSIREQYPQIYIHNHWFPGSKSRICSKSSINARISEFILELPNLCSIIKIYARKGNFPSPHKKTPRTYARCPVFIIRILYEGLPSFASTKSSLVAWHRQGRVASLDHIAFRLPLEFQ